LCLSWRDDRSFAAFLPEKDERATEAVPLQAARMSHGAATLQSATFGLKLELSGIPVMPARSVKF
jgi:hypothetical protein